MGVLEQLSSDTVVHNFMAMCKWHHTIAKKGKLFANVNIDLPLGTYQIVWLSNFLHW